MENTIITITLNIDKDLTPNPTNITDIVLIAFCAMNIYNTIPVKIANNDFKITFV